MSRANITLHIDELVLCGISIAPGHRALLQSAVEKELATLIESRGLGRELSHAKTFSCLRAPGISLSAGDKPIQLGQQIARVVHAGISAPLSLATRGGTRGRVD